MRLTLGTALLIVTLFLGCACSELALASEDRLFYEPGGVAVNAVDVSQTTIDPASDSEIQQNWLEIPRNVAKPAQEDRLYLGNQPNPAAGLLGSLNDQSGEPLANDLLLMPAAPTPPTLGRAAMVGQPPVSLLEGELGWLVEQLGPARPDAALAFSSYGDSDGGDVLTQTLTLGLSVSGSRFYFQRTRAEGFGPEGHQQAEELLADAVLNLSELSALDLALGVVRTSRGAGYLIGHLHDDLNLDLGTLSFEVSREALIDSSAAIAMGIRRTSFGLALASNLNENVSNNLDYHFRLYSDGNRSNEAHLSTKYNLHLRGCDFDVGWRLGYLSFAHETSSGYYAPLLQITREMFGGFSLDRKRYYVNAEFALGRGTSRLSDVLGGDFTGSADITLGFRLQEGLTLELEAEGENDAFGAPTGWSYHTFSAHLTYAF